MKNIQQMKLWSLFVLLILVGCDNALDLEPRDKLTPDEVFATSAGTQLYLADLYNRLPIEDLTFFPTQGFNYNESNPNNNGICSEMFTGTATHSNLNAPGFITGSHYNWWGDAYKLIRDINLFIEIVPTLKVNDQQKALYLGEASFLRAFAYFGLVKRYGGVPIIKQAQAFTGDLEALKVPRNTEKETWDFVLSECEVAAKALDYDVNGRRASKWAAYGLMSRAALHAASVAKFGSKNPMTGPAVDAKLVGLDPIDAARYYQICIDASAAIMDSNKFSLYKPTPATAEEATENIRSMFENPNVALTSEAILIKGRTIPGNGTGNNYDIWYSPNQLKNGWPSPGRMNPTLEFVDTYESYANPGVSAPIVTAVADNINDYNGFVKTKAYLKFDKPQDIFAGKDARLFATVIVPGSQFKGVTITIQGGLINPAGTLVTTGSVTVGASTYYVFGDSNPFNFSGFAPLASDHTKTGFSFKKFLSTKPVVNGWNQSTTDFMEMRYAEILLNYAEAVAESGLGNVAKATTALNATRRRAAFTTTIPLTVTNVTRERTVELAFENKRYWDLIRRREYQEKFNNVRQKALIPMLDLRGTAPYKYIFVRSNLNMNNQLFLSKYYYKEIPGIALNGLIQNPQY
ncbi:RagB/SusD family nutrient uptake outer membrane protein [Flavobacterium sp. TSSA_36]|jgi:starch-binding outer membrane protein, SusD/RagB family|uniref:RagB/SusD family nutrient uptake outer membrane protein n=1 Tax=Flavobacterium sp. TSSA_36 TaxID=3447669 RepID=UPI003F384FB6